MLAGVQLRRHLATVPAFARCRRGDLRRAARWGDLVEVGAGRTLLQEDGGNFWFFIVLAGQVRMTRHGRPVATIGPGGHFGEWAVVGLHPQPATAATVEPSILFVLGRRYVVSLLFNSAPFQRALFPDVEPSDYPAFARRMHEQARLEWIRLAPPQKPPQLTSRKWLGPRPGRTLTLGEAAAVLMKLPAPYQRPPPLAMKPHRGRWSLAAAALAGAIATAVLFLYHPPRAVITPGQPIDVGKDITITGVPSHPATARYMLLVVHVRRPNLAGLFAATLRGQATVPLSSYQSSHAGAEVATRLGRQQYLDSQRDAITAITAAGPASAAGAGAGRSHATIIIRDRGLVGPSAGLVYGLAISDMLATDDGGVPPAHLVVAATGVLEPDGTVDEVGWLDLKAEEATRAHASILLVPKAEQPTTRATYAGRTTTIYGVRTLREAIDILARRS